MNTDYLMYAASCLYFSCYLPELYANYKNKNANIYNFPEKAIVFIGTSLAFAYSVSNNNVPLITNYGPLLLLDGISMIMRGYYVYQNFNLEKKVIYIETPHIDAPV
jgi:uncharacterized protein with PQ loop repeat